MTSSDSKVQKVEKYFTALSSVASSLNEASDELTRVVTVLDEALKKLNVGLTVWVTSVTWSQEDPSDPTEYDNEQIGYCKVNGKWGIALRRIWGSNAFDVYNVDGPWLFNDAPRDMRLRGVDKIPELIEALRKETFDTEKRVREKTQDVGQLASVIEKIASQQGTKGRK